MQLKSMPWTGWSSLHLIQEIAGSAIVSSTLSIFASSEAKSVFNSPTKDTMCSSSRLFSAAMLSSLLLGEGREFCFLASFFSGSFRGDLSV